MKRLLLASSSPRRSAMLRNLGVEFETISSSFVEPPHAQGQSPLRYVKANARGKARQTGAEAHDAIVIGADTIVLHKGRVLGKPSSMDQARQFLRQLSGDVHDVLTGVCLIDTARNQLLVEAEKTRVTFRHLSMHEIDLYLAHINPLDKAGAYAIQAHGALIVERIAGCYYNVVGFPLARIEAMLNRLDFSLFDYMRLHAG